MKGQPCPICGALDGSCGDQPLAFAPISLPGAVNVANNETVYLPKQNTRRGVAGYRNVGKNMKIVDKDGKPVKQAKVITADE